MAAAAPAAPPKPATPAPAAAPAKKMSTFVQFSTAGMGGIIAWIIIHPANTVAVRMNLVNMSPDSPLKGISFGKFTKSVVQKEGVLALYNGLSAGITRQIFYATSRFGLFEVFRDIMAKYRPTDLLSRLVVGLASGAAAAAISCPAEVSLVRMSNDNALPAAQRRNYKSVLDAAVRIAREEGVTAFWRGCMPFVNRAMLVGACQVGTYDQFKSTYRSFGVPAGIPTEFCASMSSGLIYSIVTMPFETAKNRMAFQRPDASGVLPYRSTMQTISTVAKGEGVLSLWNGFLPYYARCGGHTVFMFIAVEQLRRLIMEGKL
eukprot:RCo041536